MVIFYFLDTFYTKLQIALSFQFLNFLFCYFIYFFVLFINFVFEIFF